MSSRLRRLARTVKSLATRGNTIRAVPAPIRNIETWVRIRRPGNTTIYWNPVTHTSTLAVPHGDNIVIVENDRLYRMYTEQDDAIDARIIARRRLAEREIEETYALQQKNARELAELKTETDKLKGEYDDLYAHYKRVCKYHNLSIVELEDTCSKCLCSIDGEAMMFPVSIRKHPNAYEQYTITRWLHLGKTSDPLHIAKDPVTVGDLTPNIAIKDEIDEYKELMQKTINENPLPSGALVSEAVVAGQRRRKTKKRKRTKRISRIIRRKTKIRKYSKKRH